MRKSPVLDKHLPGAMLWHHVHITFSQIQIFASNFGAT